MNNYNFNNITNTTQQFSYIGNKYYNTHIVIKKSQTIECL